MRINKNKIAKLNKINFNNQVKEIASDYNVSVNTIKHMFNIYGCLNSVTSFLDEGL
tara:strand:- start:346 stop:513 length:168 start_codon:yes stop_codon:yes gene_type:complete